MENFKLLKTQGVFHENETEKPENPKHTHSVIAGKRSGLHTEINAYGWFFLEAALGALHWALQQKSR